MKPLNDPMKDRYKMDVRPPPHKPLAEELMFPKKGSGMIIIIKVYINKR